MYEATKKQYGTMTLTFVPSAPLMLLQKQGKWRRPICSMKQQQQDNGESKNVQRGMRLLEAPYAFGYVVRGARFAWQTIWKLMMAELAPSSSSGAYARPQSQFSQGAEALDDSASLTLFEGLACPWCHRATLARALLGLSDAVATVRVAPGDDGLWRLANAPDVERWGPRLRDVYSSHAAEYRGRYTAPLLIDAARTELVSNESADVLRVLATLAGTAPRPVAGDSLAAVYLRPPGLEDEVDALCDTIYENVNNGVYRCGFATSQQAYEEAEGLIFDTLDDLEHRLSASRFLCSATLITEADVRLFPTVFRFDAVYAVLFKACRKSIAADYPSIFAWMTDIYNMHGVKETCDLDATRRNYYSSLFPLNPGGIVPVTRELDLRIKSDRSRLGSESSSV